MRSMLPLGIIAPHPSDATSFYRALGPFGNLTKTHPEFEMMPVDKIVWDSVKRCSGFFLQRPFTPSHIEMCKVIQTNRKKIWVDFDDDLLAVPTDNPTWKIYGKDSTKANVIECLKYADIMSFSTQSLHDKFVSELKKAKPEARPDTYVIPNAFDHHLFEYKKQEQRTNFIMWRGSETHLRDIMTYAPEIVKAANAHPDWTWLFLGQYPWFMVDHVPAGRFLFQDHVDPIKYFEMIKELRPSIFICPLHDSEFNRSKSNILWQESTFAGATTLVPDWPEWRQPGVTVYKDNKSFADSLEWLMTRSAEQRDMLQSQSWAAVPDIDSVNKIRWQIVEKYFRK